MQQYIFIIGHVDLCRLFLKTAISNNQVHFGSRGIQDTFDT